jgi:taurine dioxygenase
MSTHAALATQAEAAPPTRAPGSPAPLRLERLGPGFGAVVHDVHLTDLDDAQVHSLQRALVDHKVLFLRGQDLTDAGQVSFGSRLGELTAGHPVAEPAPGHAEIYRIDSSDPEFSFSDVWHTDVTFVQNPPAASILRAVTLPDTGGDTSWADSQLAYESLSAPVRRLVDDLVAVHDGNREWGAYLRRRAGRGNEWDGRVVTELPPVEHPVVRVHPESGRKGLFVNPGFTSHLVGVSDAESRGILDLLYAHLTRPEHTIRHRWAPGDVGIWDNRATAHYANNDYTQTRVMARVTIRGDRPYGPSATPHTA